VSACGYGMTRTDLVLRAVAAEIERHRGELDADLSLRSVGVRVMLNARTGQPWRVLWEPRGEREL